MNHLLGWKNASARKIWIDEWEAARQPFAAVPPWEF
jgi:hypothetical protein